MTDNITGSALALSPEDTDILNTVLSLDPIMQVTAFALKLRKENNSQCSYPISERANLFDAFPGDEVILNGHRINLATIKRYVDDRLLPIHDDHDLASAVYLALSRCNAEFSWAQAAPSNASELLELVKSQASENTVQDTESSR